MRSIRYDTAKTLDPCLQQLSNEHHYLNMIQFLGEFSLFGAYA